MSEDGATRMRAAVIEGPGALGIREVEVQQPAAHEALVRIEYCGICGTDLHSVLDGWARPGAVVGHEWSGTVVTAGRDVESVKAGDLVVGGPPTCGRCEWCQAGRPSLCALDPVRSGGGVHHGAFAEYHLAAASTLHAVPESVPARTAALAEPLAVALHGLTLADPAPQHRVLVSGAGPLGLLVVAALADRGLTDVTVAEPAAMRRTQASAVGATTVVDPADLPKPPALPTQFAAGGFDVCLETSGHDVAIMTAFAMLRPLGRLVLMGTRSMSVQLDPMRILLHELLITGAYCYDDGGIADALDLLATGRLPIDALMAADDIGLDDLLPTMRRLAAGELSMKAILRP
jgi:2-desacetyl-2-hydroxyethyl bacteriochlorophyllide A dehydrogenase